MAWTNIGTARRGRASSRRVPADRSSTIPFDGGLDLISSDLDINPGALTGAVNYEIGVDGGYEQIAGYQRFDGRVINNDYEIMPFGFDATSGSSRRPLLGDEITGASSSVSGTVIGVVDDGEVETVNVLIRSEAQNYAGSWSSDARHEVWNAPWANLKFFDTKRSFLTIDLNYHGFNPTSAGSGVLETSQSLQDPALAGSCAFSFHFKFDSNAGTRNCALRIKNTGSNRSYTQYAPSTGIGGPQIFVPLQDGIGTVTQLRGVNGWYTGVEHIKDDIYLCQVYCSGQLNSASAGTSEWEVSMAFDDGTGTYVLTDTTTDPLIGDVRLWLGGFMYVQYPYADLPVNMKYARTIAAANETTNGKIVFDAVSGGGQFTEGESLTVGGTAVATCNETNVTNNEPDPEPYASYQSLSLEEKLSTLIAAVPGVGSVLGVWVYEDRVYAFRNVSGNATAAMFYIKEENPGKTTGWTQITLNSILNFDSGSAKPFEGVTLVGATTGHTARIERTVVTSGSYVGGDAAGYFVLNIASSTFQNNEELTIAGFAGVATADGVVTATTIAPNGKFEFRNFNFGGHVSTYRMYGVDGKDQGFEFDFTGSGHGTVFTQIWTGMDATEVAVGAPHLSRTDTPTHLAAHQDQLWYSFAGGSIQHSSIGDPLVFEVVTGAGEIAIGADLTGFLEETFDSLFVITANFIKVIAGYNNSNYQMVDYAPDHGGREWSVQRIAGGVFFDDYGFTTLQSTQKFGNYEDNTVSTKIQPLVHDIIQTELTVQCSHIFRRKNRYRMFLSDKRFISMGMRDKKVAGFMVCELDHLATCTCSEEETGSGKERVFFGSDDGFVYEMESGNSFDGKPINYSLRFPFWYQGGATSIKKYSNIRLEGNAQGAVSLNIYTQYDNAAPDANNSAVTTLGGGVGGSVWDVMIWDKFVWGQAARRFPLVKLEGEGLNMGLYLYGQTEGNLSHTIRGATITYRPRRQDRRTG